MSNEDNSTAWMCHICDYASTVGEGQVCSECYKVTCSKHLNLTTVFNPDTGLYEFKQICVECQFKNQL